MASQSHLRSTYFSTPSTLAHDAYPFWSGELFNRGRASAAERVEIDVSHNALAGGLLCADGQWRQIVTIEDALKVAAHCSTLSSSNVKTAPTILKPVHV